MHSQVYDLLRRHYKHERFEGRGIDYANAVAASSLEHLAATGSCFISRHESSNGEAMIFDNRLVAFPAASAKYSVVEARWLLPQAGV